MASVKRQAIPNGASPQPDEGTVIKLVSGAAEADDLGVDTALST